MIGIATNLHQHQHYTVHCLSQVAKGPSQTIYKQIVGGRSNNNLCQNKLLESYLLVASKATRQ